MSRYYKKIENTIDLKAFDDLAAAAGKQAVGVSNSGSLYKWDRASRKAEKINVTEAMEILDVTQDDLDKIIETRGSYVVDEVKVVEPEPVVVPEVPAVDLSGVKELIAETLDLVRESKAINEKDYQDLSDKIDAKFSVLEEEIKKTAGSVDELRKAIILE